MKVLILSCNNGGGHNSVAAALREADALSGELDTSKLEELLGAMAGDAPSGAACEKGGERA